jgi:putative ABC transport system permease protein
MALEERFLVYRAHIDYDYIDLFGLELLNGRTYSEEIENDFEDNRVINESAAKALGWTAQEAVGKVFIESKHKKKKVIGVIKDFHMHSMQMEIGPLILVPRGQYFEHIALKLETNDLPTTISEIRQSIAAYSSYPFEYQFMDDKFNQLYHSELKLGEMFGGFTLLAITIASLGLFGLAAFTASQRIKEIGIRKTLGASVKSLVQLLASDLLKLVLFGFIIAIPVAWYAMDQWLSDFAYRVRIEWWMFLLAGGTAFIIALVTISTQSIRAALSNPVNCLQHE